MAKIEKTNNEKNGNGKKGIWLSLVVPAYNEESSLEKTVQDLMKTAAMLKQKTEIIVVNDASHDNFCFLFQHG